MTQSERILECMRTGEWLSPVQAVQNLYIMRLAARIYDLSREEYEIEERRVAGKTYSKYRLCHLKRIFRSGHIHNFRHGLDFYSF